MHEVAGGEIRQDLRTGHRYPGHEIRLLRRGRPAEQAEPVDVIDQVGAAQDVMDPVLELGQRLDAGVPEVDPAVVGQMDRRAAELGLAAQAPRRGPSSTCGLSGGRRSGDSMLWRIEPEESSGSCPA